MLESACSLTVPPGTRWELVVVDNGSSDATAAVIDRFRPRLPIRRVAEPEPGCARARNCGVEEAKGEYLCWTDDDVLVAPGWLAAYLESFRRHPDAAYFGGRIEPVLDGPAPRLIARCKDHWPLSGSYAERDFGESEQLLSVRDGVNPFGANFAIKAAVQRQFRYDPRLGPSPVHHRLGEELDMLYRIEQAGGEGWWVPSAAVRHVIGPERQRIAYLIEFYRRSGNTNAWFHDEKPRDNVSEYQGRKSLRSIGSARLLLRMTMSVARVAVAAAVGRPCSALGHLANCAFDLGVLSYRRGAHRAGRASAEEQG